MAIPLGPFTLLAPVAKGGMGEIWKAVEPNQGLSVAVKFVSAEHLAKPKYQRSFQQEVRAVARLDHPGIVVVHDFGTVSEATAQASGAQLRTGSPYLVMEWCTSTLTARAARLDWPELLEITRQLLDALGHAHARGVVHRDLKPSNILLATARDSRPGLKLSDFGIAHALGNPDKSIAGTPPYMAPEQIRGDWRDIGPWTDLYALGCVLWRLATGRTPFAGLKGKDLLRAHLSKRAGDFNPRFPIPEDFEFWIRRLLEKNPRRRFRRASQAEALLQILVPETTAPLTRTLIPESESTANFEISTLRAPSMGQRQKIPADWRPLHDLASRLAPHFGGHRLLGLRVLPMVGREDVRDALWSGLQRCRETRELQLVGLRGAPGVGRSRLLEWIAERTHEIAGCDTLQVAANEPGDPIHRAMLRLLRLGGLDKAAIAQRCKSLLRRVDERARDGVLAFLAGQPLADGTGSTFRALALEALAEEVRLVIALDELHASADVLEFMRFMIRRQEVRPSPLFIVATTGPEPIDVPGQWIELEPFTHAEMRVLLAHLQLAPEVVQQVTDQAAGNLTQALQIVDRWARAGQMTRSDEGYRLLSTADAPAARAGWSSRLDLILGSLPPGSLHALEVAATLGMQVHALEWQRAVDDPDRSAANMVAFNPRRARVRNALYESLLDHGLARDTDDGWAFSNAAFRQAVLDRALEGGRQRAHNLVVVKSLRAMRESDPERLGRHLVGAGYVHEGLDRLLEALDPTLRRHGPTRALAVLTACESARDAADLPARDPLSLDLVGRRAQLLLAAGRSEAALPYARRAMEEASEEGLREISARAARVLGQCHIQQMQWVKAEEAAVRGINLVQNTPHNAIHAQLCVLLSEARGNLAGMDALGPLRKAHRLLADLRHEAPRLEVDTRLAQLSKDWERVLANAEKGLATARTAQHLPAQRRWLSRAADAWAAQKRHDRAGAALREALDISRLLGDAEWPALLARMVTLTHAEEGAHAAERVLLKEARRMERLNSTPLHLPLFLAAAAVAADLGHWTETEHHLGAVQSMSDQLPPYPQHWKALTQTAIAAKRAKPSIARTAWTLALSIATRSDNSAWKHVAAAELSKLS